MEKHITKTYKRKKNSTIAKKNLVNIVNSYIGYSARKVDESTIEIENDQCTIVFNDDNTYTITAPTLETIKWFKSEVHYCQRH